MSPLMASTMARVYLKVSGATQPIMDQRCFVLRSTSHGFLLPLRYTESRFRVSQRKQKTVRGAPQHETTLVHYWLRSTGYLQIHPCHSGGHERRHVLSLCSTGSPHHSSIPIEFVQTSRSSAPQKFVCASGCVPAICYGPHYQGLTTSHVTSSEDLGNAGHFVFISSDVAAVIQCNADLSQQTFGLRTFETQCEQHHLRPPLSFSSVYLDRPKPKVC